MPRVSHHFVADRPIDAVFDVATTARFWPEWHPATRGVEGDIGHPARLGDQITEHVTIGGIQGSGTWTWWSTTGRITGHGDRAPLRSPCLEIPARSALAGWAATGSMWRLADGQHGSNQVVQRPEQVLLGD
jgi:hypothetical protein